MRDNPNKISHLLGVGLDNDDGHKRLTRADNFSIVGGSEETHDRMTETLIKTCEDIKTRGKTLHEVTKDELTELIDKNTPS